MLIVLSITFYFSYNISGCLCLTGPLQYWWLKDYIYSSCYYHHQIGSIHLSHCYHIFFRGSVPGMFVTSCFVTYCIYIPGKPGICLYYYCAVYDECNSRIGFGLQIVLFFLYITPSHYHHSCNRWISSTCQQVINICRNVGTVCHCVSLVRKSMPCMLMLWHIWAQEKDAPLQDWSIHSAIQPFIGWLIVSNILILLIFGNV